MPLNEEQIDNLVRAGLLDLDKRIDKSKEEVLEANEQVVAAAKRVDDLTAVTESLVAERENFEADARASLTQGGTLLVQPPQVPSGPPPPFDIGEPAWLRLTSSEQWVVKDILYGLRDQIVAKAGKLLCGSELLVSEEYINRAWSTRGGIDDDYLGWVYLDRCWVDVASSKMSELLEPYKFGRSKAMGLLFRATALDGRMRDDLRGDYTCKSPAPGKALAGVYRIRFGTEVHEVIKNAVIEAGSTIY